MAKLITDETVAELRARVSIIERLLRISQPGSCGLYLGLGENCAKKAGHVLAGDPGHTTDSDPSFVRWGDRV